MTTNYSIRFLKAGQFNIEMDSNLSKKEILELAQQRLYIMADIEIIKAMHDINVPRGSSCSVFDADNLVVEAIEDSSNDYDLIYQTNLWKAYSGE